MGAQFCAFSTSHLFRFFLINSFFFGRLAETSDYLGEVLIILFVIIEAFKSLKEFQTDQTIAQSSNQLDLLDID